MFTQPDDLPDGRLAAAIGERWGLRVDRSEYAAVGFGSHHWRVNVAGERWFATVDDLHAKRATQTEPLDEPFARLHAALTTAVSLREAGFAFVVAPVPDLAGDVLVGIEERYALALYPHVDGQTHGWGSYETADERSAVVDLLATIHRAPAACRRAARTETFAVPHVDTLLDALDQLDTTWSAGPHAEPTRLLLTAHADVVASLIDRYGTLASVQHDRANRCVITHGEPHRGNTITTDHGVVLVDWDTALIAPPERDLWRLIDEDASVAGWYRERTGVEADPEALELYRIGWDLADIAVYVSELSHEHDDTADTRAALSYLRSTLVRRSGGSAGDMDATAGRQRGDGDKSGGRSPVGRYARAQSTEPKGGPP